MMTVFNANRIDKIENRIKGLELLVRNLRLDMDATMVVLRTTQHGLEGMQEAINALGEEEAGK